MIRPRQGRPQGRSKTARAYPVLFLAAIAGLRREALAILADRASTASQRQTARLFLKQWGAR